jgi:protocatechuate 3,4-dioxygenase beta subunit
MKGNPPVTANPHGFVIPHLWTRRRILGSLAASLAIPGAFAEQLSLTPAQTAGPFYPDRLPLDTDNDLIILNDSLTAAVGQITHLSGRLSDATGKPIRNAVVEIWQVDGNGVYLHKGSSETEKRDKNFQGFGRFLTGSTGEYYFRTVKPVAYPGRTPHIHFAVKMKGHERWTTQCYIAGEASNERDGIYMGESTDGRKALSVNFVPLPGSKIGELAAQFNLIMGFTPASP